LLVALLLALVYVLHQDLWFWRDARPLVFGFLPIGLFYHAAYTVGASVLMWLLVKYRWPAHLEDANARQQVSHAGGPPSREALRRDLAVALAEAEAEIAGVPASEPARPIMRAEADGPKPPGDEANERRRASQGSGAAIAGPSASERVGGSGGAKPPGKK
jgi:Protein of unknown function (DUF3311)